VPSRGLRCLGNAPMKQRLLQLYTALYERWLVAGTERLRDSPSVPCPPSIPPGSAPHGPSPISARPASSSHGASLRCRPRRSAGSPVRGRLAARGEEPARPGDVSPGVAGGRLERLRRASLAPPGHDSAGRAGIGPESADAVLRYAVRRPV